MHAANAGAAGPVAPSFAPLVSSPAAMTEAWNSQQGRPQPPAKKPETMRYVVAGATIVYSLVYPAFAWLLSRATDVPIPRIAFTYLPVILVGAVLIIIKSRWGPSVTALAMLFGEFFKGWILITVGVSQFVKSGSLLLIFTTLLAYAIPAAIFVWCVREEKRRPVAHG
jgi:hypothetical protein